MLTFNIISSNTHNYFRGHAPSNKYGNCWGDKEDALVLTLEQAREFVKIWGGAEIVICTTNDKLVSKAVWKKEIHCLKGGSWYDKI